MCLLPTLGDCDSFPYALNGRQVVGDLLLKVTGLLLPEGCRRGLLLSPEVQQQVRGWFRCSVDVYHIARKCSFRSLSVRRMLCFWNYGPSPRGSGGTSGTLTRPGGVSGAGGRLGDSLRAMGRHDGLNVGGNIG